MNEKTKILIIEDDVDMVEAMKITLESNNYEVITAYEPEDGLQKAKEKPPGLIILDVMFGSKEKTEGFDYAIKMKQNKTIAPIPILMITAVNIKHPGFNFSPDTDEEYLPVDEFIDKPAQPKDLIHKVKKLLDMKISKWVNWPEKME